MTEHSSANSQTFILSQMQQTMERQQKHLQTMKMGVYLLLLLVAAAMVCLGIFFSRAEGFFADVHLLSGKLETVDLEKLANNLDTLSKTNGSTMKKTLDEVQTTLASMQKIDIERLNEAIQKLDEAVGPLAQLLQKLGLS